MSSMRSVGIFGAFFLSTMAAASMQQSSIRPTQPAMTTQVDRQATVYDINYALTDWRRTRESAVERRAPRLVAARIRVGDLSVSGGSESRSRG